MESEEDVLVYWNKIDAFQQSLKRTEGGPEFVFYDGPPFATGLPHYGHIVASTLKDIIPRYWTQMGYHVDRRWGFDTHGLPIEYEIEKKLGIKTRQEVEAYGIGNYNEACREIVLHYRDEWKKTITRLGRWVDFENDYKTMDPTFMESVWWAFSQLWKQKRIYQSVKVMPYSTGCQTPLSNFEAKSNYQETLDPSIVVKFKLIPSDKFSQQEIYLLVWTTTPWTLTSNLAICVNPKIKYQLVKQNDQYYLLSQKSIPNFIKGKHQILETIITGDQLHGLKYQPLFDFYAHGEYPGSHQILTDSYVKEEDGTGLVHQAPAFGQDDFRVCTEAGMIDRFRIPPCPIDAQGLFTLSEFAGVYFKDLDPTIINDLKTRKLLFRNAKEKHEYPYCWRTDTPLMYRTVECWFVEVTPMTEELLANNQKINWSPKHIGQNRFHQWLKNTQDWCISRNRYWGTPLPIWISDDGEEQICIGSVAELEELAGLPSGTVKDLHRHHVDQITIPSKMGKGNLHRVTEVLDCWFESGSMPYGQCHYPFENKEKFEKNYPCDFIAEGSDQTRGWFYTLLVLSTALFQRPAYKNVIVNGMVLAEDGEKMSKRKQNYPAPEKVLNQYGADALRLYLIDSKVTQADSLRFCEEDLRMVVKNVNLMIKNVMKYFFETLEFYQHTTKKEWQPQTVFSPLNNPLDSWMFHCLETFGNKVHQAVQSYNLTPILGLIETYIDQLSRWYVKLNKNRFRQLENVADVATGLSVLYSAIYNYAIIMAPFTPFLSEILYQKLKPYSGANEESVHFVRIPTEYQYDRDQEMVISMEYLIKILNQIRYFRANRKTSTSIKMPYGKATIVHSDPKIIKAIQRAQNFLETEGNVVEIIYQENSQNYLNYHLGPNRKLLGRHLGRRLKNFATYLEQLSQSEITQIINNNSLLDWDGEKIPFDHLLVTTSPKNSEWKIWSDQQELVLILDPTITPELIEIYCFKYLTRLGQDYRRKIGLKLVDKIYIKYQYPETNQVVNQTFLSKYNDQLIKLVGLPIEKVDDLTPLGQTEIKFELIKEEITLQLYR